MVVGEIIRLSFDIRTESENEKKANKTAVRGLTFSSPLFKENIQFN